MPTVFKDADSRLADHVSTHHGTGIAFVSLGLGCITHFPLKKCPIQRKTSDLAVNNRPETMSRRAKWASLTGLAKIQGCSERTLREWCKQGLIEEAYRTPGGHWRIQRPLSWQTLVFLAKRRGEWPFENTTDEGRMADDYQMAEWLLLAQLYQQGLFEDLPVPTLADADEIIAEAGDEKAKKAQQIQEEIIRRLKKKEPFWDLLLIGWMYQLVNHCSRDKLPLPCPAVTQMAKLMGLTRPAFYRRCPNGKQAVAKAYEIAGGRVKDEIPDPQGFDSVQRANRKAKKPDFSSIQKDYDPKELRGIPRTLRRSFN